MPSVIQWVSLAAGVVLNAAANILIKAGTLSLPPDWQDRALWRVALEPYLVLGVVSFALALGCYAYALTGFELSVAYPVMTSLGLIIVFLWSVTFFDEVLDTVKVVGTLLILSGVVLLTRSVG
ncbi:MAG: SMR family transporter [Candidatus Thermoplasmatota archaeon]|nr:SMR family transporter [Candidatus Thermoplasmatota archaeon]